MSYRLDVAGWARIAWVGVAFMMFGVGVGLIWWPAAQRIGEIRSHARELYDEANDIDSATRRAAQLRDAQARVEADLRSLGGLRSDGAVTAALLQLFHDEAKRERVDIREVAPDSRSHDSTSTNPTVRHSNALASYDLSIGARGPFRNVVALIADLPRHDVLIDVHDVQITSSDQQRNPPILDVTLHATIYRVVSTTSLGGARVRAL